MIAQSVGKQACSKTIGYEEYSTHCDPPIIIDRKNASGIVELLYPV